MSQKSSLEGYWFIQRFILKRHAPVRSNNNCDVFAVLGNTRASPKLAPNKHLLNFAY